MLGKNQIWVLWSGVHKLLDVFGDLNYSAVQTCVDKMVKSITMLYYFISAWMRAENTVLSG